MPTATQRPDKRWVAFARVAKGPKGRIQCYGATKEEAELKATRMEEEAQSQQLHTLDLPKYPRGSFAEFLYKTFIPHVYPGLRKPSKRSYDSMIVHHILPGLGHLQVSAIGYDELKRAVDSMTRKTHKGECTGEPLPNRRKFEVVMLAKQILRLHSRLASGRGEHPRMDWDIVEPPEKPKVAQLDDMPEGFTEALMAASVGTYMLGPHFCALFLGMRNGEVCGFMKSKINRVKMEIEVSEQLQPESGQELVPTKGDKRVIPVTPEILGWIDRFSNPDSVFVFTDKKGHPLRNGEISKQTPRLCKKAGIIRTKFHDLRHYAASNLLDLGVDFVAISEILGHGDLKTTRIYAKARMEAKREGLKLMLAAVAESVAQSVADTSTKTVETSLAESRLEA